MTGPFNSHLGNCQRVALVDLAQALHHLGQLARVKGLGGDLDDALGLEAQGPVEGRWGAREAAKRLFKRTATVESDRVQGLRGDLDDALCLEAQGPVMRREGKVTIIQGSKGSQR